MTWRGLDERFDAQCWCWLIFDEIIGLLVENCVFLLDFSTAIIFNNGNPKLTVLRSANYSSQKICINLQEMPPLLWYCTFYVSF